MANEYFLPYSLDGELVYKIESNEYPSGVLVSDLHTVDARFGRTLDDEDYEVTTAESEIEITLADNVKVTTEFFGAAPKPPHK